MRRLLVIATTVVSPAFTQQAATRQPPPLERFRALDDVDQSTIVRSITRRLSLDPDPVIQRVVSMERAFLSYPLAEPATWHRARVWAKGVAPKRTLIRPGHPAHAAARAKIPRVEYLPELRRSVWYDWGRSKIVRRKEPLSLVETFANFLAGYAPSSDQTLAQILAILDRDPKERKVAAWCGHLYADLQARVYEGISLYEAWYSGEVVDVPDVDAVPFAVRILKTRAYRSPIPRGPGRTHLYQRIRDAMLAHRKYRTLREAAAAAFVSAEPQLAPTYEPLLMRLHYLYAVHDEDPLAVAEHLVAIPSRDAFLAWADRNIEASESAHRKREARRHGLVAMGMKIRRMALAELER